MRSTNDIVGAVQGHQPATEQELRLALLSVYYFASGLARQAGEGSTADLGGNGKGISALLCKIAYEDWFAGMKVPVDVRLGPRWTPGTTESREGRAQSERIMAVFEKKRGAQ